MTTGPDLDDLREVLRSSVTALPDNVDRDHQVHARVARTRRTRAITGSVGALAVVAVASLLAVNVLPSNGSNPNDQHPPVVTPSGTQSPHDVALPTYLRGGKLIASKEGTDARGITMTFTPTSLQFGFVLSCSNPQLARERQPAGANMAMSTVNGKSSLGTGCGTALTLDGDSDFGLVTTNWGRDYGVTPGQPVNVTFGFEHHASHPGTRFRVAVYQAVPISEYPFPPAPATLSPLSESLMAHVRGTRVIWSRRHASDPNGWTYRITVHHGLTMIMESAAPGALRMYVNDKLVWTGRSWDYSLNVSQADLRLAQVGLSPGQTATIRFEADRFPPDSYQYALYDSRVR